MTAVRRSWGLLGAMIAAAVAAGCSSSHHATAPSTSSSAAANAPTTAPVQVGISPGGVTTSVSAPSGLTEEEYFKTCHAAFMWMQGKPGDPHAQIEPYLAMVQTTGNAGAWDTPWAQLTPEKQAGVILAAKSAADGMCG
ncbi:MAG TPA: lipoprotein LpqV [Mycobacterium sp.]|nr:lipoprotein LpqV [Mycobacterium sp.]